MHDDFENTVRLNPSKTFTPKPVERRDVFMHIKGPGAPQTIIIEYGEHIIGRSTEADLRFLSSRVYLESTPNSSPKKQIHTVLTSILTMACC